MVKKVGEEAEQISTDFGDNSVKFCCDHRGDLGIFSSFTQLLSCRLGESSEVW